MCEKTKSPNENENTFQNKKVKYSFNCIKGRRRTNEDKHIVLPNFSEIFNLRTPPFRVYYLRLYLEPEKPLSDRDIYYPQCERKLAH